MVILDTSIIIDHLRQGKRGEETLLMRLTALRSKKTLAISVVTIQELYEGKSTRVEEKEKDLLLTTALLKILPYTFAIAKRAGEMARDRPRPIELADAAIAATAIVNGAELFTLNEKDFAKIKGLKLFRF